MNQPNDAPEFGQPDNRTADARAADAARAKTQVERAMLRMADADSRREDLQQLSDRWNQQRPDEPSEVIGIADPPGEEPPGGEPPDDGAPPVFHAGDYIVESDQLLTVPEALRDGAFQAVLEELGWEETALRRDERRLEGRIARLRMIGDRDWGLEEELRRFRVLTRYPVTFSYVVVFGAVMKGHETPDVTSEPYPQRPAPGGCREVPLGVLDTGLAFQLRRDRWLMDLLTEGEEDPLDVLPPPPPPEGFLDAGAGHGSFVAGVVQQVVPDSRIKVFQVLNTDGLATEGQVADAMVRAVEELLEPGGRLVLNLSLGTDTIDDQPLLSVQAALDVIDDLQAERGGDVMVVAAAGNGGEERPYWPAAFDRVIGVGALKPDLSPADFSGRGPWVDCSTVGVGIRSTFVQGDEAPYLTHPEPAKQWGPDSWGQWFGTSFAAPQVAAAVAKQADEDGSSLRLALQRLLHGRQRVPGFGRVVKILQ